MRKQPGFLFSRFLFSKIFSFHMSDSKQACASSAPEAEAVQDAADLERALRILRRCLLGLEAAAGDAVEPRDVKAIADAAAATIDSIRRIRGLDDGAKKGGFSDDDALAETIARRLEAAGARPAG
jgi:hypothetical protein